MDKFLQGSETSDKFQFQTKTVTVKLVGYEEASDQYVVQNKDNMEYLSPEELFERMKKGQIFEVDDLVQQGTVSHLSDEEVIIESDMKAYQISLEDFKEKLKEVYQSQKHPQQYDCFSEKLKEIILEQLNDEELNKFKKPINEILKDDRIFDATVSLAKILKHDKNENSANAYSSKIAPNKLEKDEFSLSVLSLGSNEISRMAASA